MEKYKGGLEEPSEVQAGNRVAGWNGVSTSKSILKLSKIIFKVAIQLYYYYYYYYYRCLYR